MNKFKKLGLQAMVLSVALLFVAVAPALAIRDASDAESTTTQYQKKSQSGTDGSVHSQLKQKGEERISELREKNKAFRTRTAEDRKKFCESHKKGLTTKFANITTNSDKIQTRIDGIFAKAQAYQKAKNLTPDNYDALVAAATSAQAASSTSIATLKTLTPTLDCASSTNAADISAFKSAAEDTRDKLKGYRASVKNVLKALQIAKPAEGSRQ
ncbi:MAG: hypothetical protein AAB462_02575 [Patescibacteria group bacterium]